MARSLGVCETPSRLSALALDSPPPGQWRGMWVFTISVLWTGSSCAALEAIESAFPGLGASLQPGLRLVFLPCVLLLGVDFIGVLS